MYRHVKSVRQCDAGGVSPVHQSRARVAASGDRADLRGERPRRAARRPARRQVGRHVRPRSNHRGLRLCRRSGQPAGPTRRRPAAVDGRLADGRRVLQRRGWSRIQHQPGQPAPGHHPRSVAGTHERQHALHRVGHHPDWRLARRGTRPGFRAVADDRGDGPGRPALARLGAVLASPPTEGPAGTRLTCRNRQDDWRVTPAYGSEQLMAVTREQFESGMTYDAYKAQMTRNREQLEKNETDLQLTSQDAQAFRGLPQRLNVLALAEDWCGDVIANLPILGRVAAASEGKLNLRILLRDQQPGEQVMDEHLNKGQYKSIPTVIFMDGDFNELGVWVERPESVTRLREEKRQALYKAHPEWGNPDTPIGELPEDGRPQVRQATAALRNETKPFANSEVVREFRELVQTAAAKQPA